jgi:glycosyltransferase involved in cell wall biosynthesis
MSKAEAKKVAIVVGLKPAPDYGLSFIRALLDQTDPALEFVVLASQESRGASIQNPTIRYVWSKSLLHPIQILRAVRKERPHLVHVQHEINMFGGGRGVLLLPLLLFMLKCSSARVVTTIHAVVRLCDVRGSFSGLFSYPSSPIVSWLMKWGLYGAYRCSCRLSDCVIVHTPALADRLQADYGIPQNKIRCIPHLELATGFVHGPPRPGNRSVLSQLEGKKIVLSFGYLVRRKGLMQLIEAFCTVSASHPDHVLVLAGATYQADYERELRILVQSRHLEDRVIFTGFLEPDEVWALYDKAEFLLLSASHSFSASGPYAMALGVEKPVIAPSVGTFSETIADSVDGLLFDPQDPIGLSSVLNRMISEQGLSEKLSSAMRTKREAAKPDRIARRTLALYLEVLEGRR